VTNAISFIFVQKLSSLRTATMAAAIITIKVVKAISPMPVTLESNLHTADISYANSSALLSNGPRRSKRMA
jgi:hypothetical protein